MLLDFVVGPETIHYVRYWNEKFQKTCFYRQFGNYGSEWEVFKRFRPLRVERRITCKARVPVLYNQAPNMAPCLEPRTSSKSSTCYMGVN